MFCCSVPLCSERRLVTADSASEPAAHRPTALCLMRCRLPGTGDDQTIGAPPPLVAPAGTDGGGVAAARLATTFSRRAVPASCAEPLTELALSGPLHGGSARASHHSGTAAVRRALTLPILSAERSQGPLYCQACVCQFWGGWTADYPGSLLNR